MLVSFLALILTVVGLERVKFEDVSMANKAHGNRFFETNFLTLISKLNF